MPVASEQFKRLLWFRVGGLPEGVSEVHTPPFQLFGVVRRHVGKLPEDVEVRGVSWWGEETKTRPWKSRWVTVSLVFTQQRYLLYDTETVKQPQRHHRATPLQLPKCWALASFVTTVTTGSTSITKPVQPLCVWWELKLEIRIKDAACARMWRRWKQRDGERWIPVTVPVQPVLLSYMKNMMVGQKDQRIHSLLVH